MAKSKLLIDKVKSEFKKCGFQVTKNYYEDKSSSWLTVMLKEENKESWLNVAFNFSGTKLIDFRYIKRKK